MRVTLLKVSKSQKQFLELSILPKNERKTWKNYPKSSQDDFFLVVGSFFWKNWEFQFFLEIYWPLATSVTFFIFHFVKWILPEFSYCAMVKTAVAVHSGGCTPLNCFPPPTSRCNILIIGTFSSACTDFNPTPTLPWSSNNLTNQQQHWTNLRDTFRGNYPCQI